MSTKQLCQTHYSRMHRYGVLEHDHTKPRTCKHCCGSYTTTVTQQKYCGATCRDEAGEAMRPPRTYQCQLCGDEFHAKARSAKFCPDCVGAGISLRQSPDNIAIYIAIRKGTQQDVLDAMLGRSTVTDSGCWEWQGHRHRTGYGAVSTGRDSVNKQELAHRVTYEYATGIKPGGMSVHHKCANRACCNPEHLQLATQRDNMAEMHARKSYEAQIAELREALAESAPNHPLLAQAVGE